MDEVFLKFICGFDNLFRFFSFKPAVYESAILQFRLSGLSNFCMVIKMSKIRILMVKLCYFFSVILLLFAA